MPLHRFLLLFGLLILLFLRWVYVDDRIYALQYKSGNDLCYVGVFRERVGYLRIKSALVGRPPLPKDMEFVHGRPREVGSDYDAFWSACGVGVPQPEEIVHALKLTHVSALFFVTWAGSVVWASRRVARMRRGLA